MNESGKASRPRGTGWCRRGSFIAGLGLVLVIAGLLGAQVGLLPPITAFLAFGIGLLVSAIALVLLVVGLALSKGTGGAVSAGRAWGAALAALLVIGLSVSQRPAVEGAPAIHDISTNLEDPPAFVALVKVREEDSAQNPPEYATEFAELQQAAFPDLQSLRLAAAPAEVFAAAEIVAAEMGWEIVATDTASGRIEATSATNWFRFKDDVVIRIRADGDGSVVDLRSKSRVGRGDMGANAARIRAFIAELGTRVS